MKTISLLVALAALQVGQTSAQKVLLEVWTEPSLDWDQNEAERDGPNVPLFKTLKEVALGFGDAIKFEPYMYVNDGDAICSVDSNGNPLEPTAKEEVCDANCANEHKFCASPPADPLHSEVVGKMLMAESLRRMCVWNVYGQDQDGNWGSQSDYFDYWTGFHQARCDTRQYSRECINAVIEEKNMDFAEISSCFMGSGGLAKADNAIFQELVDIQKEKNIDALEGLPAVMINGELQTDVSTDALFLAICQLIPEGEQPDGICDGSMTETLGEEEEDIEEEEAAKEEFEEENAEELTLEEEAELDEEAEEKELNEEVEEEIEWKEEKKNEETELEKEDNELEALEAADAEIEVSPDKKDEGVVTIEVWTTPDMDWNPETGRDDGPNIGLFEHLREVIVGFGEEITFRPQMYISNQHEICDTEATEEAKSECADLNCSNDDRYCAVAPDDWLLTGKSLVEESLRRLCLWQVYGRNDDGEDDVLYFDYLAKFHELKCDNDNVSDSCIPGVFTSVNIESSGVELCIENSGGLADGNDNEILKEVVSFQKDAFKELDGEKQFPIMLINGSPLEDAVGKTVEELFEKICDAFPADQQPDVCVGDLEETLGEDEDPVETGDPVATEPPKVAVETPEPTIAVETPVPTKPAAPADELASESAEKSAENLPEKGIASPNAPDIAQKLETLPAHSGPSAEDGGSASLFSFDQKLVDTAIENLAVLKTCDVDTDALVSNMMALGETNKKLKDTVATIESDIPMLMTQTCPHDEGVDILNRMEDFHRCALFDLQELIETFPSTAAGVAMRCASAYSDITKEEEEKGFIPEGCIRTVEADSVLGRGIFGLYLYPDVACPCFEKLHDGIPECTADVWPIPLNGAQIKVQSCVVGQYCQAIDGMCEENLQKLNECLPSRDVKESDMVCSEIFDQCSSVYDNVPPMLSAAPLPDACVRVSEGSKFFGSHVVQRYDKFRHKCGENMELWEGHTPVAEFKAFISDGFWGINYRSLPFVSGALGGFFAGIIFTLVVIIVRKCCLCVQACFSRCCERCCGRKPKRNQRPTSKEYATVKTDTELEEVSDSEYRD